MAFRDLGFRVDVLVLGNTGFRRDYFTPIATVPELDLLAYDCTIAHYSLSAYFPILFGLHPLAVTFHGSDIIGPLDSYSGWVAERAEYLIAVSQGLSRKISPRCRVASMGTDLEAFHEMNQADARRVLGLAQGTPVVFFPSDPNNPLKGFQLAERTVHCLEQSLGCPVHLLTASQLPAREMALLFNAADCTLITSLREGGPIVARESLACNTPLVSVDVGFMPELHSPNAGCSVVERDPSLLAIAVAGHLHRKPVDPPRTLVADDGLQDAARRFLECAGLAAGE